MNFTVFGHKDETTTVRAPPGLSSVQIPSEVISQLSDSRGTVGNEHCPTTALGADIFDHVKVLRQQQQIHYILGRCALHLHGRCYEGYSLWV